MHRPLAGRVDEGGSAPWLARAKGVYFGQSILRRAKRFKGTWGLSSSRAGVPGGESQGGDAAPPYREGLIGSRQDADFHGTVAVIKVPWHNEPRFASGGYGGLVGFVLPYYGRAVLRRRPNFCRLTNDAFPTDDHEFPKGFEIKPG